MMRPVKQGEAEGKRAASREDRRSPSHHRPKRSKTPPPRGPQDEESWRGEGRKEEVRLMEQRMQQELHGRQAAIEEIAEAQVEAAVEECRRVEAQRQEQAERQYRERWGALRADQERAVAVRITEIGERYRLSARHNEDRLVHVLLRSFHEEVQRQEQDLGRQAQAQEERASSHIAEQYEERLRVAEACQKMTGGREWQYCQEEKEQLNQYKLEQQQHLEHQARRDGQAEGMSGERMRHLRSAADRCEQQRDEARQVLRTQEVQSHARLLQMERDQATLQGEMISAVNTLNVRNSVCELAQKFLEERSELNVQHLRREQECVLAETRLTEKVRLEYSDLRCVAQELNEEIRRSQKQPVSESAEVPCPKGTRKKPVEDDIPCCSTIPGERQDGQKDAAYGDSAIFACIRISAGRRGRSHTPL